MKNQKKNKESNNFLYFFINLIFSIGFYVLANPNYFNSKGFSYFAWLIYLPVLLAVDKSELKNVWIFGGIYGSISSFLINYWLINYDLYTVFPFVLYFFLIYSIFFIFLCIANKYFPKNGWLLQWLIICSFEYLRTKGFLGFSYGITAYTQWNNIVLIQICKIIGVFGLNMIIVFPSCVVYSIVKKIKERKYIIYLMETDSNFYECKTHINYVSKYDKKLKNVKLKIPILFGILYCIVIVTILIYGNFEVNKVSINKKIKVALIQHNENPFENGISIYRQNVQKLMSLTDSALDLNPDIEIVVWPETAVVPSIEYQFYTKKDENRYVLINSLLNYMNIRKPYFIIGNGISIYDEKDNSILEKYNSALLFKPGENVIPPKPEVYSKIHLVPFSEYFPYGNLFPKLNKLVIKHETNMWTPGNEYKIFSKDDFNFATLICFEDTFSDIARKMYKNGARCFVNLSNDSWSKSEVCQNQHLATAIFRSVENKVPTIRSTTSGQTCIINELGKIEKIVPSFCETYVVGDVSVIDTNRKETLYTKIGDVFGYVPIFISIVMLIIRMIIAIINRQNKKQV